MYFKNDRCLATLSLSLSLSLKIQDKSHRIKLIEEGQIEANKWMLSLIGTIFVNFSLIIETCRSSVQNFVQVYLIETTELVIRNKW